jgi:sortase A
MRARRLALGGAAALVALGLWQVAEAGWIHAKARLAQHLLEQAWERSSQGEPQARPWPWSDTWPVARLRVPRLGVDLIVLAGASGRTLAFGPGHHDGTASPGAGAGNAVISGHRDTHFRFLEALEPGDELVIERADGGLSAYRVAASAIVDYRQARLPAHTALPRLTLVTCYPFDAVLAGGPLRYLVVAEEASTMADRRP